MERLFQKSYWYQNSEIYNALVAAAGGDKIGEINPVPLLSLSSPDRKSNKDFQNKNIFEQFTPRRSDDTYEHEVISPPTGYKERQEHEEDDELATPMNTSRTQNFEFNGSPRNDGSTTTRSAKFRISPINRLSRLSRSKSYHTNRGEKLLKTINLAPDTPIPKHRMEENSLQPLNRELSSQRIMDYNQKIERILNLINSDSDISSISKEETNVKKTYTSATAVVSDRPMNSVPQYRYYVLVILILTFIVGYVLNFTYTFLNYLKKHADKFLLKTWISMKQTSSKNNILMTLLVIPFFVISLILYMTIWIVHGTNKTLLKPVPKRFIDSFTLKFY